MDGRCGARYGSANPVREVPTLRRRRVGQALVETALIAPLVLFLVLAVVDFARVYATSIVLQDAAQAGARLASDYTKTNADVQNRVIAAASPITVATTNITSCVGAAITTCAPAGTMATRAAANSGQRVIVTVQLTVDFNMAMVTQWVGLPSVTITQSSMMVIV